MRPVQQPKRVAFATAVIAGLLGVGMVGVSPTAAAAFCAIPTPIFVNSGSGISPPVLRSYSVSVPSGALSLASEVPLIANYGDIALTEGGVLYAATFSGSGTSLVTLSTATGLPLTSVPIVFSVGGAPLNSVNALSAARDGSLYVGTTTSNQLFRMTPAGVVDIIPVTLFPTLSTSAMLTNAGDALTLPDGDLLVLASGDGSGWALRVNVGTGVSTIVGSIPPSFGAALSGELIYLAGADGIIRSLASIPTAASESPLTLVDQANTGLSLFGASSLQDSGGPCPTAPTLAETGTFLEGPVLVSILLLLAGASILFLRRARRAGSL